ncbi:MAG: hypothetical protein IID44_27540 [Planctomycetes bacterium]|nr:hypothetical protein [Planctomycetota bacterium]
MTHQDPQHFDRFELFDPALGTVIREPVGAGEGYWVGAPGVMFDEIDGAFYLTYRVRRPRGVKPDRGAEVHLARSSDGVSFETIWTGTKDQLGTTSIERCAIRRLGMERWVLYVSYVDPADGRWRTDYVLAARPEEFDLSTARKVLTADDIGAEGVKDPFVFQVAGLYHMLLSFATTDQAAAVDELHGTSDAYNTGLIRSATGLATSSDGINWRWEGEILGPSEDGWDCYCSRIGCIWRCGGVWLALYDGSADVSENYEERVGLAFSFDLRTFHRATRDGPLATPPRGEKAALRYFDVLDLPEATFFYYEMARQDGSHDLRVFRRAK